jgi:hypothetical protein
VGGLVIGSVPPLLSGLLQSACSVMCWSRSQRLHLALLGEFVIGSVLPTWTWTMDIELN